MTAAERRAPPRGRRRRSTSGSRRATGRAGRVDGDDACTGPSAARAAPGAPRARASRGRARSVAASLVNTADAARPTSTRARWRPEVAAAPLDRGAASSSRSCARAVELPRCCVAPVLRGAADVVPRGVEPRTGSRHGARAGRRGPPWVLVGLGGGAELRSWWTPVVASDCQAWWSTGSGRPRSVAAEAAGSVVEVVGIDRLGDRQRRRPSAAAELVAPPVLELTRDRACGRLGRRGADPSQSRGAGAGPTRREATAAAAGSRRPGRAPTGACSMRRGACSDAMMMAVESGRGRDRAAARSRRRR